MTPINCPKCSHKIADKLDGTGSFKVSFIEHGRKNGQVSFMTPASFDCRKCQKRFFVEEILTQPITCDCQKTNTEMVVPKLSKRRSGNWISINLSSIRPSVECFDALLQCRNKECDVRMFLSDFINDGKILASADEEKASWLDFTENGIIIRGLDEPPREVIDTTI